MKLATYDPNVKLNNINGEVKAYDTGTAGAMMGRSLQGLAGAINFAGEQIDAVNVQAASNEYTKRLNDLMYNQENGLMNTKYQGADGITAKFEEEEKKIRQEVGKQFRFYSPKGTMVFDRLTNNSATQRYELVRKHQTQQFEAYKDVTFNNAIEQNTMMAADNYSMPDVVSNSINEAVMSTRVRLNGQGEEVIKAAERKVVGQIAQQVINRAYANGNDDMAGTYIEKYGKFMNPAEVTQYSKAVHQRMVTNITRNTAESLVAKYGNNPAMLYNAIYKENAGGTGYDGEAAVEWMKKQASDGANWGVNTCTKGVNAAIMSGGAMPGNLWAPTNWEEAKKSGIAFTDRSQLRSGDIVYWWKPGEDKDADDTSHVGIYDAKTGKVYQSGTSGFSPIDLDKYSVTGFARPQGTGMTLEQKDALYASCMRQISQQKAVKNAINDQTFNTLEKQLMNLADSGNTDFAVYTSAVDMVAGADPDMRRKGYQAASYWCKYVTDKTAPKPLGPAEMDTVTQMIRNTDYFDSEADLVTFMQSKNFSIDQINSAKKLRQQKQTGDGIFKYPQLNDFIADAVKNDGPQKSKERSILLRQYAIDYINSFRAENKRDPNYDELSQALSKKIVDSKIVYEGMGEKVTFSPLDMTRKNVSSARPLFDKDGKNTGMIRVKYRDGNTADVPIAQFRQEMGLEDGASWRDYLDGLWSAGPIAISFTAANKVVDYMTDK